MLAHYLVKNNSSDAALAGQSISHTNRLLSRATHLLLGKNYEFNSMNIGDKTHSR